MDGGDRCDEGEAEPEAVVAGAVVEAGERQEQPADLAGWYDLAGVDHSHHARGVVGGRRDADGAARDVVALGVVEQVGDEPFEQDWVAGYRGLAERGGGRDAVGGTSFECVFGGRAGRNREARERALAAPAPARLAAIGLATRKLRAALSALGIAIGVAAIVAVLGLSSSSAAGLNAEIAALGTNLLMVENGQTFAGTVELPKPAPGMIARLQGVTGVQDTGTVNNASAYKSPKIPAVETNALSVDATSLHPPRTAGTSLARAGSSTPPPPANPSACSAPPRRSGWASTGSGPGSGSGPGTCGSTSWASSSPRRWPPTSTPPC